MLLYLLPRAEREVEALGFEESEVSDFRPANVSEEGRHQTHVDGDVQRPLNRRKIHRHVLLKQQWCHFIPRCDHSLGLLQKVLQQDHRFATSYSPELAIKILVVSHPIFESSVPVSLSNFCSICLFCSSLFGDADADTMMRVLVVFWFDNNGRLLTN